MYKVETETVIKRKYDYDPELPFKVDEKTMDRMVRKAAGMKIEDLMNDDPDFIETETEEKVVGVWRGDIRIYPRAMKK